MDERLVCQSKPTREGTNHQLRSSVERRRSSLISRTPCLAPGFVKWDESHRSSLQSHPVLLLLLLLLTLPSTIAESRTCTDDDDWLIFCQPPINNKFLLFAFAVQPPFLLSSPIRKDRKRVEPDHWRVWPVSFSKSPPFHPVAAQLVRLWVSVTRQFSRIAALFVAQQQDSLIEG